MLYHVMVRTPTGSLGVGAVHLVAREPRRGFGPVLSRHLTAGAKIAHGLVLHPKHANVMLPTVNTRPLSKTRKRMSQDVLKDLNTLFVYTHSLYFFVSKQVNCPTLYSK